MDLKPRLSAFAEKLKVPGIAGGLIESNGCVDYAWSGTRRRGINDPILGDDQWHIGSCTKSITALLFARLVEEGLAAWTSPIPSFFPDLARDIDLAWNNVSVDELFVCQAGMRANPTLSGMLKAWSDNRPLIDQRSEAAVFALSHRPKKRGRFLYSNLGYIVIGAAIDRIAGTPYETALSTHILEPLCITSVGYGPPPHVCGHKSALRLGNLALFTGKPAEPENPKSDNPRAFSSAGTLHINPIDWTKLLSVFLQNDTNLMKSQTIASLLQPPEGKGLQMAKGWAEFAGIEGAHMGMQGSNTMWSATAVMNKDRTRMSFLLCNDGRTSVLNASALFAAKLLK